MAARLPWRDACLTRGQLVSSADLVERVTSGLDLTHPVVLAAQHLAGVLAPHCQGRNPMTVAAAAVQLSAQMVGRVLALDEVSKRAGISVSTLQSMLQDEGTRACLQTLRVETLFPLSPSSPSPNKRKRCEQEDESLVFTLRSA